MIQKNINIQFYEYPQLDDIEKSEKELILKAIEIANKSYSPYSNFPVGAAVLLANGEIFAGNNQENIAFPSGTCAERTVLNYVNANFPDEKIEKIAIVALNATADTPASPCGFCRQVIVEMEMIQKQNLKVILHKLNGTTYAFESAKLLLPLAFEDDGLGK